MVAHAVAEAMAYPAVGARLDIENVNHAFDIDGAALPVLQDVNLIIEPGELVALLGPSGCGKSTLLRLVAGLERPRTGTLREDDVARALVNDPKILVLDEPLGKLDSLTRITMQAELVSLWQRKGFTTLLVTHDAEEALFLANRVIVLSERPARIKADIVVQRPHPRL
jgi:ABC-type nitrate/sulfonate/bicarbonate transport system ATPase subunit